MLPLYIELGFRMARYWTNLSLSPEESWLPIASILFCIVHIQFSYRCLWDWFALAPSRNETEGTNAGNRNLAGNLAQSGPTFRGQAFQSLPQAF
ncbi:hypothetical protein RIF29_09669 [Crotalaria pallida]|uniref:Uncharacterized protein n=1 Tax=Crotalaria pallida TaxID=3830 RepID=A0AAN9FS05_CROPI